MKYLQIVIFIIGILSFTGCGGESSSNNNKELTTPPPMPPR